MTAVVGPSFSLMEAVSPLATTTSASPWTDTCSVLPTACPFPNSISHYLPRPPPCFRERWSARILQDEFFLSVTRTFDRHEMTDQQLPHAIDTDYHGICIHVDTAKRASHPIRGLHPGSSSSTGSSYLTPCREVVESCSQCLTDYETTVERGWVEVKDREKKKVRRAFWSTTIASYHRLGAGRSPFDEKWHAFSLKRLVDIIHVKRDMVRYPPGSVRQVWMEAES